MNGRQLHEAIFSGEPFDRLPLAGVGTWQETRERWNTEGLGEGDDHNRVLGLWSEDYEWLPLNLNMAPAVPLRVLKKDHEYVTLVDFAEQCIAGASCPQVPSLVRPA